jgi:hypothetical protein
MRRAAWWTCNGPGCAWYGQDLDEHFRTTGHQWQTRATDPTERIIDGAAATAGADTDDTGFAPGGTL